MSCVLGFSYSKAKTNRSRRQLETSLCEGLTCQLIRKINLIAVEYESDTRNKMTADLTTDRS